MESERPWGRPCRDREHRLPPHLFWFRVSGADSTELLILGSPKAATPLMAATPTLAIDLPLLKNIVPLSALVEAVVAPDENPHPRVG
jgi:hypothetical protein